MRNKATLFSPGSPLTRLSSDVRAANYASDGSPRYLVSPSSGIPSPGRAPPPHPPTVALPRRPRSSLSKKPRKKKKRDTNRAIPSMSSEIRHCVYPRLRYGLFGAYFIVSEELNTTINRSKAHEASRAPPEARALRRAPPTHPRTPPGKKNKPSRRKQQTRNTTEPHTG